MVFSEPNLKWHDHKGEGGRGDKRTKIGGFSETGLKMDGVCVCTHACATDIFVCHKKHIILELTAKTAKTIVYGERCRHIYEKGELARRLDFFLSFWVRSCLSSPSPLLAWRGIENARGWLTSKTRGAPNATLPTMCVREGSKVVLHGLIHSITENDQHTNAQHKQPKGGRGGGNNLPFGRWRIPRHPKPAQQ